MGAKLIVELAALFYFLIGCRRECGGCALEVVNAQSDFCTTILKSKRLCR
ncbi:hypothetical protein PF007_g14321 [Phytophthora fragariae]|uniref:Uncharacterized protein n=1 Tax=Phytophthora fragariae TaxID=53985 RepID=A0A6A4CAG9_9STRA|nr:hypothetical protein PF009_g15987 [Phytophthora fragariae]KAE9103682.1 hypothetical protein PF007_g14321 [Phytophthora fragariae]KAE9287131.1 hypothetical protein PF001_g21122 [Phytophthora fragariae]